MYFLCFEREGPPKSAVSLVIKSNSRMLDKSKVGSGPAFGPKEVPDVTSPQEGKSSTSASKGKPGNSSDGKRKSLDSQRGRKTEKQATEK